MPDHDPPIIDNTLRLTADENGFLQLVAEFAGTPDQRTKNQLAEFLRNTDMERVRRIGFEILGQSAVDLRDDERKLAERFKKMVVDYRRNIEIFNAMGPSDSVLR